MATDVQTGAIDLSADIQHEEESEPVVKVEHVSMVFNMASQQLNSLKEYAIALFRHELMFKEFRALNDISFEVEKGDVFGILAPNGSGKSTLLKIISGVLSPTEGSVEVRGRIAPLIELTAGFDMELTGRENIYLNGSLLGHSRSYIEEHFDDIIEFAEVEDFLDMPLKNYSSGMVSRIAFAIATVMVPDILIVDEVLSVGDFMFQEKCEARIQDLIHNHGVTVLIVSHSIDQIERLCNKAIWIEKSHPRMIGSASDVATVYKMLGGHKGSAESENVVLSALMSDADDDDVETKIVAGRNRYDTAVEVLNLCRFKSRESVVITNSDNTVDRVIALGLAGAMGVPLMSIRAESIPDCVSQALRWMEPSEVIVLDSTATITDEVIEALARLGEREAPASIVRISGSGASDLARKAQAYASDVGADAQLFDAGTVREFDLVTMSPLLYAHGLIVRIPDDAALIPYDAEDESTRDDGEGESSIGVARYGALSDYVERFSDSFLDDGQCSEVVFVTSHNPSDSLSVAPYVAQHGANMVLLNHRDLDNFASAIRLLSESPSQVEQLTFIGDEYCFTKADRKVLAKASRS